MQICSVWPYTLLFTDCLITSVHSPNIYFLHTIDFWKRVTKIVFIPRICFDLYKQGDVEFCGLKGNKSGEIAQYERQFCTKNLSSRNSFNCGKAGFCTSWQLGNAGLEKLALVHKGSAHVGCFLGTQASLGCLPSSWWCKSTRGMAFHKYTDSHMSHET